MRDEVKMKDEVAEWRRQMRKRCIEGRRDTVISLGLGQIYVLVVIDVEWRKNQMTSRGLMRPGKKDALMLGGRAYLELLSGLFCFQTSSDDPSVNVYVRLASLLISLLPRAC